MQQQTGRSFGRRLAAAIGAVALTAVTLTTFAGAASAAPANVPTTPGSLTIHKYEQPATAGAPNNSGTAITVPVTWVPIQGVNFTITPIDDVDLTTTQGWDLAATYAADPALATDLGTPIPVTTDATGSVATAGLPIGAYLVTEIASPGAVLGGTSDPANITMTAAPFVVTVPLPATNGAWNSDVHVYPKNSLTAVDKVPGTPQGSGLGSILPWTVTVKVPTLAPGESFTSFDIVDTLDTKLAYVTGSASATVGATAVALTDNSTAQIVDVAVTDLVGLEAFQGQDLVVTFNTTVEAAGEIVNEVDVYINDPARTNPTTTSNPATSYWGPIQINKHAAGDTAQGLSGAQFAVYASAADAAADQNRITVAGQTVFTTADPDGSVVIPGLYISNTVGDQRSYFLRELVAPAGFTLVNTPIEVVLTANGTAATPVEIDVPNPQQPSFSLPLTGAAGTIVMTVLGVGLLGGGAFLALVAGRRRKATQV